MYWEEKLNKFLENYHFLKNDGIYHMKVLAKDISGHVSEEKFQVIIDKTNPVIRYVETLNGQQLKKFKWDYPVNQMIRDFTTYVYEMRVDGKLYHMGEVIDSEGRHRMTVKATDAAGNKAQMTADFVVDHTAPEIIFRNIEGGEAYEVDSLQAGPYGRVLYILLYFASCLQLSFCYIWFFEL